MGNLPKYLSQHKLATREMPELFNKSPEEHFASINNFIHIYNHESKTVPSSALIDSGASACGFVDAQFAHNNNLSLKLLEQPRSLCVFDGTESSAGQITHIAMTSLTLNGHTEKIYLFVTTLAQFDLVLGLPWLQLHNPKICWSENTMLFNHPGCKKHTMKFPAIVKALAPEEVSVIKTTKHATKVPAYSLQIESCNLKSFEESAAKEDHTILAVSMEDINEALSEKPKVDPAKLLPEVYHKYLSVFSKDEADRLPPHRPSDHRIILKPGSEAPWGPLYGMSREELLVLQKYIKENLQKGFIRPSSSPASSPVLFVKKLSRTGIRFHESMKL